MFAQLGWGFAPVGEVVPDRASSSLLRLIVPSVQAAPDVVGGHCTLDRDARESVAFTTFDSHDAATALRDGVRGNADAQRAVGPRLLAIRVVEVQASA
jgi:hypothetical protein